MSNNPTLVPLIDRNAALNFYQDNPTLPHTISTEEDHVFIKAYEGIPSTTSTVSIENLREITLCDLSFPQKRRGG